MMQWLMYTIGVGSLLAGAAWLAEAALRWMGRPTRWAWVAGIAGSLLIPLVAAFVVGTTGTAVPEGTFVPVDVGLAGLELGEVLAPAAGWNTWLLVAWAATATLATGLLGLGIFRLRQDRRTWRRAAVDGVSVRVSAGLGPAVVGILEPEIVVPESVLDLPTYDRDLILRHESEHIRARDPWLLALAGGLVALVPWHLPVVLQVARLRRAVEVDCDRRVIRAGARARSYAELLVRIVHERSDLRAPLATPALAENRGDLAHRIKALRSDPVRHRRLRLSGALLAAAALVMSACEIPVPSVDVSVRWNESEKESEPAFALREGVPDEVSAAVAEYQSMLAARQADLAEAEKKLELAQGNLSTVTPRDASPDQYRAQQDLDDARKRYMEAERRYRAALALVPQASAKAGEGKPLVYVDGERFRGQLEELDPDAIDRIEVLKGSAAASFGPEAASGVVQIYLRKSPIN